MRHCRLHPRGTRPQRWMPWQQHQTAKIGQVVTRQHSPLTPPLQTPSCGQLVEQGQELLCLAWCWVRETLTAVFEAPCVPCVVCSCPAVFPEKPPSTCGPAHAHVLAVMAPAWSTPAPVEDSLVVARGSALTLSSAASQGAVGSRHPLQPEAPTKEQVERSVLEAFALTRHATTIAATAPVAAAAAAAESRTELAAHQLVAEEKLNLYADVAVAGRA
mmetsp:Transcript_92112/g.182940  ORF Transcript_92112/g.182940 Transcript_92112/m.182940 type:complete len:217 (-) Transcript_92112:98-748(-)